MEKLHLFGSSMVTRLKCASDVAATSRPISSHAEQDSLDKIHTSRISVIGHDQ